MAFCLADNALLGKPEAMFSVAGPGMATPDRLMRSWNDTNPPMACWHWHVHGNILQKLVHDRQCATEPPALCNRCGCSWMEQGTNCACNNHGCQPLPLHCLAIDLPIACAAACACLQRARPWRHTCWLRLRS